MPQAQEVGKHRCEHADQQGLSVHIYTMGFIAIIPVPYQKGNIFRLLRRKGNIFEQEHRLGVQFGVTPGLQTMITGEKKIRVGMRTHISFGIVEGRRMYWTRPERAEEPIERRPLRTSLCGNRLPAFAYVCILYTRYTGRSFRIWD